MHDVALTPDLVYAQVDGQPLHADLYRPATEQPPPVVIYVHGGGFEVGSRRDGADTRLRALASHGIAVLSIDYRLSPGGRFPDQLHDVKAAIRWLRASGNEIGVAVERIGLWGASAGAVLAALAGLTGGNDELEGTVGQHLEQSSAVQAVITWFGVSDLLTSASRSTLEAQILPFNFESALLGVESAAAVQEAPALARQASPLTWVTSEAPPFLIAHGDRDRVVPVSQSAQMHTALSQVGAQSTLLLLAGAGHEDAAFEKPSNLALTAAVLASHLHHRP